MTRKDYELIAKAIALNNPDTWQDATIGNTPYGDGWRNAIRLTAAAMARELAANNARFDKNRFLQACGVTGEA